MATIRRTALSDIIGYTNEKKNSFETDEKELHRAFAGFPQSMRWDVEAYLKPLEKNIYAIANKIRLECKMKNQILFKFEDTTEAAKKFIYNKD